MSELFSKENFLLEFSLAQKATLVRRRMRFLGDVLLQNEPHEHVVHVPNTGSLKGVLDELRAGKSQGALLSEILDPASKRKYSKTLEAVNVRSGQNESDLWVGINTQNPNRLLKTLWEKGFFPWKTLHPEFQVAKGCRFDFLADAQGPNPTLIEVKNVSLVENYDGAPMAFFPDSVSDRALKHLKTMERLVQEGSYRAEVYFLIQRPDPLNMRGAHEIDQAFAEKLKDLMQRGVVKARALTFQISHDERASGIKFHGEIPVVL